MKALKKHLTKIMATVTAVLMLSATPVLAQTTESTQAQRGESSIIQQLQSVGSQIQENAGAEEQTSTNQNSSSLQQAQRSVSSLRATGDGDLRTTTHKVEISTPQQLINHLGAGANESLYDKQPGKDALGQDKPISEENGFGASADVTYTLTTDIDMSNKNFVPVPEFNGVFNGNGFTIKNLTIVSPVNVTDGGFFRKMGEGSVIDHVTFDSCRVTGKTRAGMIAAESYGRISRIMVSNGIVALTEAETNKNTVGGGLVGKFVVSDKSNDNTDTLDDGYIKDCIFSGNIVAGSIDSEIANDFQKKIGGVIGELDKNSYASITYTFWDMAKSPSITSPVGGVTTGSPAVGIKMKETHTLVLDGVQNKVNLGELVTTIPTITLTGDTHIQWFVEDASPAGCVSEPSGSIVTGTSVGTAKLVCKVVVSEKFTLPLQCGITVEGDKTALRKSLALANEYKSVAEQSSHYDEKDDTVIKELHEAITQADGVIANPLATDGADGDIDKAIKRLDAVNKRLLDIDKELLTTKMNEAKDIIDNENGFYESLAELSGAYDTADKASKNPDITSADIRTLIGAMDIAKNNLRLLLQEPLAIERVEDDGDPYIKIMVSGYLKTDEDGNKLSLTSNASLVEVSMGATANPTVLEKTNLQAEILSGVMTIKIPKTAAGYKGYNLQTVYNVVIEDTLDGRTMKSKKTPVTLEKKPNYVKGHVNGVNLGNTTPGTRYDNLNVTGIPVTYNPKTGEEDGSTTSGTVISWEYDKETAIAEAALGNNPDFDPEATEIDWTKTGVKYLVGIIKDPADGSYVNPESEFKVRGKVEVVDKSLLEGLISTVNGYKEADYLKETWTPFKLALDDAKKVNNDKTAGQAAIDKAYNDLSAAMDALKSQPIIVLKEEKITIGVGDIFEPLMYVKSLTDVKDAPKGGDVEENILFSKLVVTTGQGEEQQIIYQNGSLVNPLDTTKTGAYQVTYTVTNSSEISASASMTVTVYGQGTNNGDGDGDGSGGDGNGGNNNGGSSSSDGHTVKDGTNTVTDPSTSVTIEFEGLDIFTEEEIKNGVKLILEVSKVEDESTIRAILEKLASVLKGEVTIDGIYDITLYKELNGEKTKISNSSIKNPVTVWLPISQKAIDSNDYAVIHALENNGYDLFKGTLRDKDGKNFVLVKSKSFSQYAVVYGGGISSAAATLDTSATVAGGGSGSGGSGSGGSGNSGNQGGGDGGSGSGGSTGTVWVATGDSPIVLAIATTAAVSLVACVVLIMIKKRKYSK